MRAGAEVYFNLDVLDARTWTAVGGQVAVAGSVTTITAVDAAVFVVSTGVRPRVR